MHRINLLTTNPRAGLIDNHLITVTRLLLSLSALLVGDNPLELHYSSTARMVLILYIIYSLALYFVSVRKGRAQKHIPFWTCWVDMACYTALIWLSDGANGFLFFGYLFAILAASFGRGFWSGLVTTIASSCIIILLDFGFRLVHQTQEMRGLLIRSLYVFVLGYLIAHWGNIKITFNRRMSLLQKLASPTLSRMGVDTLIGSSLHDLCKFYNAHTGLLLIPKPGATEHRLYRIEQDSALTPSAAEIVPKELLQLLLTPSQTQSGIYGKTWNKWWRWEASYQAYDVISHEPTGEAWPESKLLATMIDSKSFITVPLRFHNSTVGRLYLTAQRQHAFNAAEINFLLQFTEHLIPRIETVWFIDRLASDAAEEERQRIARDIHDSIIQPYIGLQMGLVGLHRRLVNECVETNAADERLVETIKSAACDAEYLIEVTDGGISDLRSYVRGLRKAGESEGSLLSAVQRYAAKFTRATNILVQIRTDGDIDLPDGLVTEVFQMIVEGLSNVRKHTQSMRAYIGMTRSGEHLVLRIENDSSEAAPKSFTPRSITERAETLGGRAYVEIFKGLGTAVVVEIPL